MKIGQVINEMMDWKFDYHAFSHETRDYYIGVLNLDPNTCFFLQVGMYVNLVTQTATWLGGGKL